MPLIIKNRAVVPDSWVEARAFEGSPLESPADLPKGPALVPLSFWERHREELAAARAPAEVGVWLAPNEEPAALEPDFPRLGLIAVDFPVFRDGRGLSAARLLREKHGWAGELRAIGDVLRDTMLHQERCGFDSFAVRPDKDIHDALKAFGEFSLFYQSAADGVAPMFLRREEALARLAASRRPGASP